MNLSMTGLFINRTRNSFVYKISKLLSVLLVLIFIDFNGMNFALADRSTDGINSTSTIIHGASNPTLTINATSNDFATNITTDSLTVEVPVGHLVLSGAPISSNNSSHFTLSFTGTAYAGDTITVLVQASGFASGSGNSNKLTFTVANPVITTSSTISSGDSNPQIILSSSSVFSGTNTIGNLNVDPGTTGLTYASYSKTGDTLTVTMSGTAKAGTISITALGVAFATTSPNPSGTVSVQVQPSTDATLSSLVLGSLTLSGGFASGTTSYTSSASNAIDSVTVVATPTNPNIQSIVIKINDSLAASTTAVGTSVTTTDSPVALSHPGATDTVTVTVTAENNSTLTYTVVISRAAVAPVIASVIITGTPTVGQELTAVAVISAGSPTPTLAYEWETSTASAGSYLPISGATNETYTVQSGDVGKFIKVKVTATNIQSSDSSTSTYVGSVINIGAKSVTIGSLQSGVLIQGQAASGHYVVTTNGISDTSTVSIHWWNSVTDSVTSASAPNGLTLTAGNLVGGSATLTIGGTPTVSGARLFDLTIDGTTSIPMPLIIVPSTLDSTTALSIIPDVTNGFQFTTAVTGAGGSSMNVTVNIPPGALSTNQQFEFASGTDDSTSFRTVGISKPEIFSGFLKPIQITLPDSVSATSIIAYSNASGVWHTISPINPKPSTSEELLAFCAGDDKANLNDGYFDDGSTITIYSCHLTEFGYRGQQAAVTLSSAANATIMKVDETLQMTSSGGSGTGSVTFASSTTDKCSIDSSNGLVTAIASGTCSVTSTKAADAEYIDSKTSTAFTITISAAKLSTPSVTAASGSVSGSIKATFGAISHSSSYTANVYSDSGGSNLVGSSHTSYTSGTDITGLTAGTTYYVKVIAIGDGTNYSDSDASTIQSVVAYTVPSGGGAITYYAQPTVTITTADSTIQLTKTTTLSSGGGGGTGATTYSTTTPTICSVTSAGVVTGLLAGTCVVKATKAASGAYLEASSSNLSITVSDSDAKAAEAAAAAAKAAADKAAADKAAADKAAADAAAAAKAAADKAAADAAAKVEADRLAAIAAAEAQVEAARLAILNKNEITWKKSGTKYVLKFNLAVGYAYEVVAIQTGTMVKGKLVYKTTDYLALDANGDGVITQKKAPVKGTYLRVLFGKKVVYTYKVK